MENIYLWLIWAFWPEGFGNCKENKHAAQSLSVLVRQLLGATTVSDVALLDFHTHLSVGLEQIYSIYVVFTKIYNYFLLDQMFNSENMYYKFGWMPDLKVQAALFSFF